MVIGQHKCKHRIIKSYPDYNEKKSCGGISLFFHMDLLPYIIKWWRPNSWDWNVVRYLKKSGGHIFSTKTSIIQHIGENGYFSKPDIFDKTDDFEEY